MSSSSVGLPAGGVAGSTAQTQREEERTPLGPDTMTGTRAVSARTDRAVREAGWACGPVLHAVVAGASDTTSP
jgi:hypothetical protein